MSLSAVTLSGTPLRREQRVKGRQEMSFYIFLEGGLEIQKRIVCNVVSKTMSGRRKYLS